MNKGTMFRRKKSIKNWGDYNEGLKRRYDSTVWIEASVFAKPGRGRGQKGRSKEYSDVPIEFGCTLNPPDTAMRRYDNV